jgi:hypothetical protein
MEAIRSSETSVFTRPTRRHTPEDGILHSHCRENLKSHIATRRESIQLSANVAQNVTQSLVDRLSRELIVQNGDSYINIASSQIYKQHYPVRLIVET